MKNILLGINGVVALAAGCCVIASGVVTVTWLTGGILTKDPRLTVTVFLVSIATLALMLANMTAIDDRI